MSWENETLRFPTNLDRAAIVERLVKIRESAQASGVPALASMLAEVEGMSSAHLGLRVLAAIAWLAENPAHRSYAGRFEILAVNLKNLK